MILWHDLVEIVCFSTLLYYAALWLSHDQYKNLLMPFYGYWAVLFSSYFLELSAITMMLALCAPVIATLFVIVHQRTMQTNFVSLCKLSPRDLQARSHWLEELTRTLLYAINKQRNITCVIEHTQSLEGYITAPYILNVDIQKGIFESFIHDDSTSELTFFWITTSGKLITSNGSWNYDDHGIWLGHETASIPTWQQDALLFTSKTDSVVVRTDFKTHTISVVAQGKIIEQISPTHVESILKTLTTSFKKEDYEALYKKNNFQQTQP